MGDPWEELERFSDPELLEFSKRLDVELSGEELKATKRRVEHVESLKIKCIIVIPILALVGLAINGKMLSILASIYYEYPAYALTHAAAVLAWDVAVIYMLRPGLYRKEKRALELALRVKKPVLAYFSLYHPLTAPLAGFIILIFSSYKPLHILYKNPKGAIIMVIAYHVQIFIPLISYLVLRLTRTPVILSYSLIVTKFAVGRPVAVEKLWQEAREYRPLTLPRVAFIGVSLASTIGMLLLIGLVRLLHIEYSTKGIETIARMAPLVTLGVTPIVTVKARNLLARVPPTTIAEGILTALNVLAAFTYTIPFFVILLYYCLP
ncbi:hypothetical protein [Methanopyrus kandleri]|uniref:Uncharacterized protein n=1 Tax=Methanopyrus kandleri TaxID=2320 RepID=A0A832T5E7_9EURY|nr:hypothetical protein [Methanopyrus kandleri]HII69819.1 hypothetical protein [Methanopyrus kandleri]